MKKTVGELEQEWLDFNNYYWIADQLEMTEKGKKHLRKFGKAFKKKIREQKISLE